MNSGIFPGTENALEAKITKTLSVSAKDDVKVRLKYKLIFFFFRRIGYEGNLAELCQRAGYNNLNKDNSIEADSVATWNYIRTVEGGSLHSHNFLYAEVLMKILNCARSFR